MEEKSNGFIAELLASRASTIEAIFIAILLSLSINLISSGIPEKYNLSTNLVLLIGLLLGFVAIIYLLVRFLRNKNKTIKYNGFLVHERQENYVLSVPRYQYGEFLARILKSAFNENKAFKRLWDNEPLDNCIEEENGALTFRYLKSHKLIVEATEYFILSKLSAHISDYFRSNMISENELDKFSRKDIPDVLLSNRFLELFSRPMDQRAVFINDEFFGDKNESGAGKTVFAIGKGGAMYDQFKLVLPKKSKVRRLDNNIIELITNRFSMKMAIYFSGAEGVLPFEYHKFMLDFHDSQLPTRTYEIIVRIDIKFKPISFLTLRGWNFYYWAESFIDYFEEIFDLRKHLEIINWEASLTILNFLTDRNELYRQKYN